MQTEVTSTANGLIFGTCKCPKCRSEKLFTIPISASATSTRRGYVSGKAKEEMSLSASVGAMDAIFDLRKLYSNEINFKKEFDRIAASVICQNCNHKMEWSGNEMLKNSSALIFPYLILLFMGAFLTKYVLIIGIIIMIARIVLTVKSMIRCIKARRSIAEWDRDCFPIVINEFREVPDLSQYDGPMIINSSQRKYIKNLIIMELFRQLPVIICGCLFVSFLFSSIF